MTQDAGRPPSYYWNAIAPFYRDLIDHYGWQQRPMLDLVEELACLSWTQSVYPSTSHHFLCLSLHERWEDSREAPLVGIGYSGDEEAFRVDFLHRRAGTSSTETHHRLDEAVWKRVREWLKGVSA